MAFKTGSPMVVALGQQYNTGEKPTVLYCILTLIAMQGHQKNSKTNCSTLSNMVLIIYIGCGYITRYTIKLTLLRDQDYNKYVHVCVYVFSSHSFWTSSSLDVPAGVIQEKGHTGFLIHLLSAVRALIFLARRIQPFLSFVDREVEFWI